MGSLPDSKYIIKTDGYWFVEAHDVDSSKGYITVSAKGIVNGLSNIPNDGADFGPDTYNPSYSGSGIPYTQTSGIQEALTYAFNAKGGKIIVRNGIYDFTNTPFVPYLSNTSVANGTKILIPYNDMTTNNIIPIQIVGESSVWVQSEITTGSFSNPPSNGVVFRSLDNASTLGIDGNNHVIMASYLNDAGTGTAELLNGVDVYIDQISFVTLPATGIGGIDMQGATSLTVPNLVIGVNTNYPIPEPSSSINSHGFKSNTSGSNKNDIGNLYVYGYYKGVYVGAHAHIRTLWVFANFYAIDVTNTINHGSLIDFIDAEWNVHIFYISNGSPANTLTLHITKIVVTDNQDSANMAWADAVDYIHIAGSTLYFSRITVDEWEQYYAQLTNLQAGLTGNTQLITINDVIPKSFNALLTPTVPTSGTAQTNNNGVPVNVYLYGGTVTVIDYIPAGGSATQVGTSGPATVRLNPGDSITLTYSGTPTWNWVAV